MRDNDRKYGFWLMLVTDPVLWLVLPGAVFGCAIVRSYWPVILGLMLVTMAVAIWWIARNAPSGGQPQ